MQILRARFRVRGQPAVARLAHFLKRVVAGEVHDVDGRAGHFGKSDGAGRGFALGGGRASERVILRRGFSLGQGALHQHVDRAAVFRVHADHAAMLGGLQHRAENRGVVQHEHTRIGHEQFERRNAFAHQRAHFFQLRLAKFGNNAMERIVGHGLALGLFHPGVKRMAQGLALVLNGKINQCGRAAKCGRARARLEIVGAGGAAKRHIEMRVHVDPPGDDDAARGVEKFGGIFNGEFAGNRGDQAVNDAYIARIRIRRGDNRAVADDGIESHASPSRAVSGRVCILG